MSSRLILSGEFASSTQLLFTKVAANQKIKPCASARIPIFSIPAGAHVTNGPTWPEATQRALILVFEQIETCHIHRFPIFRIQQTTAGSHREILVASRNRRPIGDEKLADMLLIDEQHQIEASAADEENTWQCCCTQPHTMRDQRERQVIVLRFFEELSDKEIGEQLQITTGNVRLLTPEASH